MKVNTNNRLLPRKICTDCQRQVVAFYTFKQKSERVEKLFLSIFSPETNAENVVIEDTENVVIEDTENDIQTTSKMVNSMDEHANSMNEMVEVDVFEMEDDVETFSKDEEIEIEQDTNNDKIIETSEINANIKDQNVLIVEENANVLSMQSNPESSNIKCSSQTENHTRKNSNFKLTLKEYFANAELNNSDIDEPDGNATELTDHSHHTMRLIIKNYDFFPCHNCRLLYVSKDKLNEHNSRAHPKLTPEQMDESCTDYAFLDNFKVEKVYACGECKKPFSTANGLKIHVLSHAGRFECPFENCANQYKQLARLNIHVFKKHINTKHQTCFHCNQTFDTYDDLQKHIRDSCKAKIFGCSECGKFETQNLSRRNLMNNF